MSTYAIGDVQGCFQALQHLLDTIAFNPENDTLWFTGDLINRGANSLDTIRFIYQLSQEGRAITVLGNHDLALLSIAFGGRVPSAEDTCQDILNAPDRDELLHWLRLQPLIHTDIGYTMVHAGIPPQWSIATASALAREVENILQGSHYTEFLKNMFGNAPHVWQSSLTGTDRARHIVNALTRMRFCKEDGELDLTSKGIPDHPPAGFKPWFDWDTQIPKETKIIFGHWAALNGECPVSHFFALDTGCVWGECLTALCLETQTRFAVKCN